MEPKHSESEIRAVLQQVERGEKTIAAVCRELNIARTTFIRWRDKYGHKKIDVGSAAELERLRRENAQLRRLLVDALLELGRLKGADK